MDGSEGFVEKGESLPLPRKVGAAAILGNFSRSRFCLVDIPPVRLCGATLHMCARPEHAPLSLEMSGWLGSLVLKSWGRLSVAFNSVQLGVSSSTWQAVFQELQGMPFPTSDVPCLGGLMCSMCRGPGPKVTLGKC